MKKYCNNCKYLEEYGLNGNVCDAPGNTVTADRYWGVEESYISYPQDINKNNDCKNYKASISYKILKFLKLKD